MIFNVTSPYDFEKTLRLLRKFFETQVKRDLHRHEFYLRPSERKRVKKMVALRRRIKEEKRAAWRMRRV